MGKDRRLVPLTCSPNGIFPINSTSLCLSDLKPGASLPNLVNSVGFFGFFFFFLRLNLSAFFNC